MATLISSFLVVFSLLSVSFAQQNISLTSSLTPSTNSSWLSSSGLYAFGFYRKGNGYALGIFLPDKTVVWTADRDSPPVSGNASLLFNSDAKLVLRTSADEEDQYVANPEEPAVSASMLDSGNFVLYNSDHQVIWQTFDFPTNTLLPGQHLSGGAKSQQLFSSISETDPSTGIFRLRMQADGNLVQYPVAPSVTAWHAYWSSGTSQYGSNVTLNLDNDSHLYLLNGNVIIRNLTNGGYPTKDTTYLMRIDPDGIIRLYMRNFTAEDSNWLALWSSTNDKCSPKGLCGLNGLCFMNNQDAECQCLPGFAPVSEGNKTSGCKRNFTSESCNSSTTNGSSIRYNMQEVTNTVWENTFYSSLSPQTKDTCKKTCLEDCNCEVALFKDGACRMQRLPLRFGRRARNDSSTALVKVGYSTLVVNTAPSTDPNGNNKGGIEMEILVVGIVLISFASVMLAIYGILMYKNHVGTHRTVPRGGNIGLAEETSLRSFTYAKLEKVTNNFSQQIGKGAFGAVYKGAVQLNGDTTFVAVKRLQKVLTEGEKEFQNEIKAIGRTHHRNLVRLLGYCLDGSNRLLVYEYMSNGSLADVLFTPARQPGWEERMEIARNIARGILYLHEECETQIIHCDIKPQNILMDEYGRARISDFGLAKLLKPDQSQTFTGIRGTRGYVAPEWHRKLPVTVKADVYSFGIVLLEIICCRRSVDSSLTEEEAILEEWVYQCFENGELGRLVGDEEVDQRELERVAKVGLWCILDDPSIRPSMKKVLHMLEGTESIPTPPNPSPYLTAI